MVNIDDSLTPLRFADDRDRDAIDRTFRELLRACPVHRRADGIRMAHIPCKLSISESGVRFLDEYVQPPWITELLARTAAFHHEEALRAHGYKIDAAAK